MFNHLNGKLIEKNPAFIVVECAGVGYIVQISLHTFSKLADSEHCKIFTHQHITEDAHTLYGFADEDERRLFRLLISVSGVGCNTARMMLSSMSPSEIQDSIAREDVARLRLIKGIGEKTAQRIIIELKDKVRKDVSFKVATIGMHQKQEAMSALLTLGFARQQVEKSLNTLLQQQPLLTVEELIRQALKTL